MRSLGTLRRGVWGALNFIDSINGLTPMIVGLGIIAFMMILAPFAILFDYFTR